MPASFGRTPLYLGIDLGTSGCRAIAIDAQGEVQGEAAVSLPEPRHHERQVSQDPALWWQALVQVMDRLCTQIEAEHIQAIAVDATSSTVLLCDAQGNPRSPALMYNDARAVDEAQHIAQHAPAHCAAHGPSSGLAKLLWLQAHADQAQVHHVVHQADWLMGRLCGRFGLSDTNNCLKMGYDPIAHAWPAWLDALGVRRSWLPRVVAPGSVVGTLSSPSAGLLGLSPSTRVVAGTTDSTAGFIATGAQQPGEAVTSLGSTLVLKVISLQPVFAPQYGVYSQPLGQLWLVGGGSNAGGTVLRQHFTPEQVQSLSARIDPEQPTGLDYYPLPGVGERFPVADPELAPRLSPRPADDLQFFQGILEGIARIEQQGYLLLSRLGAPYPTSVRSIGGGAANPGWTRIRERLLQVPMLTPHYHAAAYGAAVLARQGVQ